MQTKAILRELVAIPSVNPMGRNVSGPEFLEGRVSDYLVEFFKQLDVPFERIEVAPGRANVIARLGSGSDRTTLFDAHQDTVPVDGMTIAPFDPVEHDGRLYGRGSCDVKGGMAAMLAAFARLASEKRDVHLVMSCTCDEEATVQGVTDLVKHWTVPVRASRVLSSRPAAAIIAEPTELDVVVAHKGATRWKLRTTGRACHSSSPGDGINAIFRMARVLPLLEEFQAELSRRPAHPLCGPPTLSVGRIEGGVSVNTVPDECLIEIDRRVIPGERASTVIDELAAFLQPRLDFEIEMLPPWVSAESLSDTENKPLADSVSSIARDVAGRGKQLGVPYGTHASRISAAGVPSVVFGPGSIAQAHTKDEWISLEQLEKAAEIYYRIALKFAG